MYNVPYAYLCTDTQMLCVCTTGNLYIMQTSLKYIYYSAVFF